MGIEETAVESPPASDADITGFQLLEMHRAMLRIRRFEEKAGELYSNGDIPGFLHLSIGQEAAAVGACWPLTQSDGIVSTHRGHGHCLAKGADMASMFAELMGRESGTCRGRAGSMHIADPALGIYGANGIVAAGLPMAAGIAEGFLQQGRNDVMVAFFGDGSTGQGAFHEALNLAALWNLPMIFFCENNQYAEFSPTEILNPVGLDTRAASYGIECVRVDGNNVIAVSEVMQELVERCRAREGPFVVEALTYRWGGHYQGDPERYRSPEEVEEWKTRDPLLFSARLLKEAGKEELCRVLDDEVAAEVGSALETARHSKAPSPDTLGHYVIRPRTAMHESEVPQSSDTFKMVEALREALIAELEQDDSVWVAGIDVADGGGVFTVTKGLAERFRGRILDTPISETAIMGLAVGGALAGTRPIVELMYLDFVGVCFDQIMNQAAKMHFMTGGRANMSLVIRTQFGAGRSSGSQHSQSLEALLAHIPGLTVLMPSTPADAYGLLRAAIRDPNPVVFIENRLTYGKGGPRPPANHIVPIGKACVRRPGSDATVITWSRMVDDVLTAAERVAEEGVNVEVIDLRSIVPLDTETIFRSVEKTNRALIVHEAVLPGGWGAEIAARIADECFWNLDAPVSRLAPPGIPAPYAPSLEHAWLPSIEDIEQRLLALARI